MIRGKDWAFGGYLLGIPIGWAYWAAHGIVPADSTIDPNLLGALVGIFASPLWPLHILVEAWLWILS